MSDGIGYPCRMNDPKPTPTTTPTPTETTEAQRQQALEQAEALTTAGDWPAAEAAWLSLAQSSESEAPKTAAIAWAEHGRCCMSQGRLDEAKTSLLKAQSVQPDAVLAYRLLGYVAADQQDWNLAAEQWEAVLKNPLPPPEQAEALAASARAFIELEDFKQAATALGRLVVGGGDWRATQELRALLAERQEDWNAAALLWLDVAKKEPDDPVAWTSHARFCLYLHRNAECKSSVERALAAQPDYIPARAIGGRLASAQRDWPSAASHWRAVLEASSEPAAVAEALYDLINALIELDEFTEAETLITRLEEAEPDRRKPLEMQAVIAEKKSEWNTAADLWREIALLSG